MSITVAMIEEKEFKTKVRGYDPVEVDEFLDLICDEMIVLQDEIASLQARLAQASRAQTYSTPVMQRPATVSSSIEDNENAQRLINRAQRIYEETIADAKRGDIGNTSAMYARTFFEEYNLDSVTVAPYMGEDSVTPFLGYDGKWVILLALTSNKGSHDFQLTESTDGEKLFQKVLRKSQEWAGNDQMMYVVGATQGQAFEEIRKIVPDHFLLVPGVGAQGGSLSEVCKYGMTQDCCLLVNSSRAIIYADNTENFANAAAEAAKAVQQEMAAELDSRGI